MGNICWKSESSLTECRLSETYEKSEFTNLNDKIYSSSSSPSKDSLNYAENVTKAISQIEGDKHTPEMRKITKSGDLSRIHEIVAEAENVKGKWKTLCIVYADELFGCFKQSDGAVLHALIQSPSFHLFKSIILNKHKYLSNILADDNPVFRMRVRNALLPHIDSKDEHFLRRLLFETIVSHHSMAVCEFYDSMWSKSLPKERNEGKEIRAIYCDILEGDQEITNVAIAKTVLHIGISRHINAMLDIINDPSLIENVDDYTKSRLLEWAISSNFPIQKLYMLKHIDKSNIMLVKQWCDERNFFSSQISDQRLHSYKPTISETMVDSIVPRILEKMAFCSGHCKSDEKSKATAWLIGELYSAMEREFPFTNWRPILVGSAAEYTHALYIDEFDYLLLINENLYDELAMEL